MEAHWCAEGDVVSGGALRDGPQPVDGRYQRPLGKRPLELADESDCRPEPVPSAEAVSYILRKCYSVFGSETTTDA